MFRRLIQQSTRNSLCQLKSATQRNTSMPQNVRFWLLQVRHNVRLILYKKQKQLIFS
jgi:hypothetical protein